MIERNLGPVSAYAVAVSQGFTGTEEEWMKLQADAALHSREAKQAADGALESAQNAQTAASGAKTSETAAGASAGEAKQAMSDMLAMLGKEVATLVGGKIPMDQIPATATQEIYTVSDESELTTLTAQRGDLAELLGDINGEKTVIKTWQCLGDASVKENWVVWGTSYAVQSGNADRCKVAEDAERVGGLRFVTMTYSEYETAVKDPDTLYLVDLEK